MNINKITEDDLKLVKDIINSDSTYDKKEKKDYILSVANSFYNMIFQEVHECHFILKAWKVFNNESVLKIEGVKDILIKASKTKGFKSLFYFVLNDCIKDNEDRRYKSRKKDFKYILSEDLTFLFSYFKFFNETNKTLFYNDLFKSIDLLNIDLYLYILDQECFNDLYEICEEKYNFINHYGAIFIKDNIKFYKSLDFDFDSFSFNLECIKKSGDSSFQISVQLFIYLLDYYIENGRTKQFDVIFRTINKDKIIKSINNKRTAFITSKISYFKKNEYEKSIKELLNIDLDLSNSLKIDLFDFKMDSIKIIRNMSKTKKEDEIIKYISTEGLFTIKDSCLFLEEEHIDLLELNFLL